MKSSIGIYDISVTNTNTCVIIPSLCGSSVQNNHYVCVLWFWGVRKCTPYEFIVKNRYVNIDLDHFQMGIYFCRHTITGTERQISELL
jgi:hypothetical protein